MYAYLVLDDLGTIADGVRQCPLVLVHVGLVLLVRLRFRLITSYTGRVCPVGKGGKEGRVHDGAA